MKRRKQSIQGTKRRRASVTFAAFLSLNTAGAPAYAADQLIGRAVLPATTFVAGPTSGQQLGSTPINGQPVPFINKQPVQGFSAVAYAGDGRFWVMADNGYGAMENSSDFNLRVYKIHPEFKTAQGGSGNIQVEAFIELRDPTRKFRSRSQTIFPRSGCSRAPISTSSRCNAPMMTRCGSAMNLVRISCIPINMAKCLNLQSLCQISTTQEKRCVRRRINSTRKPAPCAS